MIVLICPKRVNKHTQVEYERIHPSSTTNQISRVDRENEAFATKTAVGGSKMASLFSSLIRSAEESNDTEEEEEREI